MVFILCLVKIYNPYCKQICLIPVQNRVPKTGPFFMVDVNSGRTFEVMRTDKWLWTWKVFRMYILSRLVDYPIPAIGRGSLNILNRFFKNIIDTLLNEHHFKCSIKCTTISKCIVHLIVQCIVQVSCECQSCCNLTHARKIKTVKFRAKIRGWSKRLPDGYSYGLGLVLLKLFSLKFFF